MTAEGVEGVDDVDDVVVKGRDDDANDGDDDIVCAPTEVIDLCNTRLISWYNCTSSG